MEAGARACTAGMDYLSNPYLTRDAGYLTLSAEEKIFGSLKVDAWWHGYDEIDKARHRQRSRDAAARL